MHTWTEYINRLIGVLGGVVVFLAAVWVPSYFFEIKESSLHELKPVVLTWVAVGNGLAGRTGKDCYRHAFIPHFDHTYGRSPLIVGLLIYNYLIVSLPNELWRTRSMIKGCRGDPSYHDSSNTGDPGAPACRRGG